MELRRGQRITKETDQLKFLDNKLKENAGDGSGGVWCLLSLNRVGQKKKVLQEEVTFELA